METLGERPAPAAEELKAEILNKINQILGDLGSSRQWLKAPEDAAEYAPLKNKRVVMVDDSLELLHHYAPVLTVATQGKAAFVHYEAQDFESLVQQILDLNPDVVLMDYHLSKELRGTEVIRALKERQFSGEAVGFSSDIYSSNEFIDAGAKGMVDKSTFELKTAIRRLAELVSK